MEKEIYQSMFDDFMSSYTKGAVSAEEVGELIAKLAGFYPNYNMSMIRCDRARALVSKEIAIQIDETTGKSMSSAKAEVLADATSEMNEFKKARAHIANLEMLIGSAKALQRGLLQEMSHTTL